ncbi:MAG: shikimate kinase [Campylobacterota bacterium]|nr:shikimate kinase [Campylobacterota bacterium]
MVYDNIILIGFMGSGKTAVGKILARYLHKSFVDVDSVIEKEQGASINELFENKGEKYFRSLEQTCINTLTQKKGQIIATGGGLPIYSTIPPKSLIIYLDADFDNILARLPAKEHAKRPLLQDEEKARSLYTERINTYKALATFTVDANQTIQTFIHVIVDFVLDKRVL